MTRHIKKISTLLIGVLILIILIIGAFYYWDKFLSRPLKIRDVKIDTKAALKLNILKQISKKNGITEWSLEAASATLMKDKNIAVLIDVSVIFFTKDEKKVHMTSRKGELNTKTHDMVFSDHVVVAYETSVLTTDKLHYTKKDHIIYADARVVLKKENSVIEADSMTTRLNENEIVLNGNVKGYFSENFKLQ